MDNKDRKSRKDLLRDIKALKKKIEEINHLYSFTKNRFNDQLRILYMVGCALKKVDPDNSVFNVEEGVLTDLNISTITNFLNDERYEQYRKSMRDGYKKK